MASLVESGMTNIQGGDADSVGFFQMRVGIWNQGDYAGYPHKPELQVKWFLDQAEAVKKQRIAAGKPIDDPNSFGEWIADVERPAEQYRGRYQLKLDEANGLLGQGRLRARPRPRSPPRPAPGRGRAGGRRRRPQGAPRGRVAVHGPQGRGGGGGGAQHRATVQFMKAVEAKQGERAGRRRGRRRRSPPRPRSPPLERSDRRRGRRGQPGRRRAGPGGRARAAERRTDRHLPR